MDKDARFKEAVDSSRDRIYRLCRSYIQDPDERMDVHQEVLIHLWESIERFEGKSHISTWIYRITVNTCLAHLRSEKRRKRIIEENSPVEEVETGDESEREAAEQSEADLERLYGLIHQLPPFDRAIISLYLEDLELKEIAEILGISEVNARVKLHRIRQNLKQMWERDEHGPE